MVRSRNKSTREIIIGFVGALYTAIVLGNHPVRVELQRIFFESVRQGVTKRKILVLPFRKQNISQIGFVRLAVIRLEAPELDLLLLKPAFKTARTTMIAFGS